MNEPAVIGAAQSRCCSEQVLLRAGVSQGRCCSEQLFYSRPCSGCDVLIVGRAILYSNRTLCPLCPRAIIPLYAVLLLLYSRASGTRMSTVLQTQVFGESGGILFVRNAHGTRHKDKGFKAANDEAFAVISLTS